MNIQWHPAFHQAIWAELADYEGKLEFIPEYQLTTEPLIIDMLIIKKPPGVTIDKNIGKIFRGHNIIEYKSPEDSFTLNAYYKAFAYLYLYSSLNSIDISDTTLTCVVSSHPRDLLKHLRGDASLKVEEPSGGIYYITGERFPVQIIETKFLSENENLWLKSLRNNLEEPSLKQVIIDSRGYGNKISAYLYAVFQANANLMEGAINMTLEDTLLSFPEFMERLEKRGIGNIAQIRREAEEAAKEAEKAAKEAEKASKEAEKASKEAEKAKENKQESIKLMLLDGMSYEKIAGWMLIPVEEVERIDKLVH